MQRLLTLADLDDRDPSGCSVTVRHDAVLSEVVLLDDDHWATLERSLARAGIGTDSAELRALPHEVVLSDRLRRRLKAG